MRKFRHAVGNKVRPFDLASEYCQIANNCDGCHNYMQEAIITKVSLLSAHQSITPTILYVDLELNMKCGQSDRYSNRSICGMVLTLIDKFNENMHIAGDLHIT